MHIGIITGGKSSERPVALRSAENMRHWIESAGHTWEQFDLPNEIDAFLQEFKDFDCVFPIFHGEYGEDGVITGLCEAIGVKVAFSKSSCHALCINKLQTNILVEKIGVTIPQTWIQDETNQEYYQKIAGQPLANNPVKNPGIKIVANTNNHLFTVNNILSETNNSLIIKPNKGGSSIGTYVVTNSLSFTQAVNAITSENIHDFPIIQERIPGREFTVGVFKEGGEIYTLPIMEILTGEALFDYREKYETDGSNEVFLQGEEELQERLRNTSKRIYDFLDCNGIIRIDYRFDGNEIYFLEVNTIPGFTKNSFIPKMWIQSGRTQKQCVDMLLNNVLS